MSSGTCLCLEIAPELSPRMPLQLCRYHHNFKDDEYVRDSMLALSDAIRGVHQPDMALELIEILFPMELVIKSAEEILRSPQEESKVSEPPPRHVASQLKKTWMDDPRGGPKRHLHYKGRIFEKGDRVQAQLLLNLVEHVDSNSKYLSNE